MSEVDVALRDAEGRRILERLYRRPLGDDEWRDMKDNLLGFFRILAEWDARARAVAKGSPGSR